MGNEVQTEEDKVLFAANFGTVLLDIEVIDMRNRVWKLVENEDECLKLIDDVILSRMTERILHSTSTPEILDCYQGTVTSTATNNDTESHPMLPAVVHAPLKASRRAYALIAKRLMFKKHLHRSHQTDNQRGRRKGSRHVLSLYRGSNPTEWHLNHLEGRAEGVSKDYHGSESYAWRGSVPKTRIVKEMVAMRSPEQRDRIRAKEYQLHKQRLDSFFRESTAVDLHSEYAIEKKSHLDTEKKSHLDAKIHM